MDLDTDSVQEFSRIKSGKLPVAYVVRNEDLPAVKKFKDLVFDRGRKNRHKSLSFYLLGREKIPVLQGTFLIPGKLTGGIAVLLAQAVKSGDRNVYIIGANSEVFNDIWKQAPRDGLLSETRITEPMSKPAGASAGISRLFREEVPSSLASRFVGDSYDVQLVRQLIIRAAKTRETVMILGDSGTGKEIVARCIHDYSDLPALFSNLDPAAGIQLPFVPVNCGAIPGELLESVLFGNEKGAYTDAYAKREGLWREAGHGTLFLDELADLRLDHQAKVLRALQEKKIRPIGGSKEIDVPARVIVATNRDLYAMMRAGMFREDLYYRLRTFLIRTPSLRDHPEDIPILAKYFWREITRDSKAVLPESILTELHLYRWPGNARELRAVLTNLMILFGKENLDVEHLKIVFQMEGQAVGSAEGTGSEHELSHHRVECLRHLRRVDEVVNACKIAILPAVETKAATGVAESVNTALRRNLNELEWLCLRPLLFHTEFTFSIVYRLKGKLSYCLGLLETDPARVARFWKKELAEEFKFTLSTVFKEVHQLLNPR